MGACSESKDTQALKIYTLGKRCGFPLNNLCPLSSWMAVELGTTEQEPILASDQPIS